MPPRAGASRPALQRGHPARADPRSGRTWPITSTTWPANQHSFRGGSQSAASLSRFWCRFRDSGTVTPSTRFSRSRAKVRRSSRDLAHIPESWASLTATKCSISDSYRLAKVPPDDGPHGRLCPHRRSAARAVQIVDGRIGQDRCQLMKGEELLAATVEILG